MSQILSTKHQPRFGLSRLVALLVAFTLLLAACGDDSDSATSQSSSDPQVASADDAPANDAPTDISDGDESQPDSKTSADDDMSADEPEFVSEDGLDSDSAVEREGAESLGDPLAQDPGEETPIPADVTALFVGLQIIKTGDVVLEAPDVAQTTKDIIATVFANGGAIWGQETQTNPEPRAELVIRVPPLAFDGLLAALTQTDGVGLASQSTTSDDVTDVVIDLDARISAAESSVARVQERLDAANDLNTIFTLEEEVATRQANLERLRGQRETIGDQIALSTINLTIVELDPDRKTSDIEVVTWLGDDRGEACPGVSDLSIGADDKAVLCVNIHNTGEDVLTSIDIHSTPFRLRVGDFTVEGDGTLDALQPGEELLASVDLEADGGFISRVDASNGLQIAVTVTAIPETTENAELTGVDTVFISTDVDDPLPGFGDSFSGGWNAMVRVVSILLLVLGAVLPFIPLLLIGAWASRKLTTKSRERADARAAYVEAYTAAATGSVTPPPPSAE
jgi:hypothetical protein